MNTSQFLCDEIVQTACPELQASPLYIVESDDLDGDCYGFTSHWPQPAQEAELKRSGRWRGDGAIIAVYPQAVRQRLQEHGQEHRYSERMRQLLAHELGHLLPAKTPVSCLDDSGSEESLAEIESIIAKKREANTVTPEVYVWSEDHGQSFTRRCLHLWWRCQQAGIHFPVIDLCAGLKYGQSCPELYLQALGDEPEKLRNATFREILRKNPPREFMQLWHDDVEWWSSFNQPKTERKAS